MIYFHHSISIPLLSRFYENSDKLEDFYGAVRAIAAFFTLWRSIRGSTAGIDSCYRKLMLQGEEMPRYRGKDGIDKPLPKINPFRRDGEGGGGT